MKCFGLLNTLQTVRNVYLMVAENKDCSTLHKSSVLPSTRRAFICLSFRPSFLPSIYFFLCSTDDFPIHRILGYWRLYLTHSPPHTHCCLLHQHRLLSHPAPSSRTLSTQFTDGGRRGEGMGEGAGILAGGRDANGGWGLR